jgi:predicted Zn-dependent peptidase
MSYRFEHARLSNGLTIIGEVSERAHSASIGFFVRTGARDEPASLMGVSHFLEHMMFKGCDGMSGPELNRAFDEIGARHNAYTSAEMTCFHAHSLPEAFPRACELLARMLRPTLGQGDFDTEKNVILEEIAMYEDNPFFVLYEACLERHYAGHPLAHRVLGTAETIRAMKRDEMRAYFERRYSADNTVVAFAGHVDFARTCEQIESLCASWLPTQASREDDTPVVRGGEFEISRENVGRGYILALCPAPSVQDDRRYAAALLSLVLGMPGNSRLHWALVEPGIAESAAASYDPHDGTGEFLVYATGEPSRLDEIWAVMHREMERVLEGTTDADLERLRNKLATGTTVDGELPHDRMQRLGRLWMYLGRYHSLEEELERISAVTLDDLRSLTAEFAIVPRTAGRLAPPR